MSLTRTFTIAAALTLIAGSTQAQERPGTFSLELRPGAGLPTKALGSRDLKTGYGSELIVNLQVMPHLSLYAGWDYMHFSLEEKLGSLTDAEDTGYAFGARFFAPSLGPVTPWIRAGGVYDHVELEGDDNNDTLSSDHTLGWEAGAGAAIALGGRWSLLPGVRYRSFSPDLAVLGGEVDMNYVNIDVGISYTFGGRSMAAIRQR